MQPKGSFISLKRRERDKAMNGRHYGLCVHG
jgi:hypothetical protein